MSYPQFYTNITRFWRTLPHGQKLLEGIDKALVGIIAAGYGVELVWLLANGDSRWIRCAAVPFAVLVLVTALRKLINAPRPFEAFAIDALVPGSTAGQSMPSRHVASAVIIACALGYVNAYWGIAAGIASVLVAYVRVVGGRHFIRDVAAAAALSLLCAFLGFIVL